MTSAGEEAPPENSEVGDEILGPDFDPTEGSNMGVELRCVKIM